MVTLPCLQSRQFFNSLQTYSTPHTIMFCPSILTTLVQLSMPVVAVWYSSNVLSFSRRKRDVFPTPSSPSNTTLYVGPRLVPRIAITSRFDRSRLIYWVLYHMRCTCAVLWKCLLLIRWPVEGGAAYNIMLSIVKVRRSPQVKWMTERLSTRSFC